MLLFFSVTVGCFQALVASYTEGHRQKEPEVQRSPCGIGELQVVASDGRCQHLREKVLESFSAWFACGVCNVLVSGYFVASETGKRLSQTSSFSLSFELTKKNIKVTQ